MQGALVDNADMAVPGSSQPEAEQRDGVLQVRGTLVHCAQGVVLGAKGCRGLFSKSHCAVNQTCDATPEPLAAAQSYKGHRNYRTVKVSGRESATGAACSS